MSVVTTRGQLERWGIKKLLSEEIVKGSSRRDWLINWIPHLVRLGALRKSGASWIGTREAIEKGLLAIE